MPSKVSSNPSIPLARWADRQLHKLADETGSARIAGLDGATLMGERGSANGYTINGKVSAGIGGSRLMPTRDGGWFALTLLRPEDRELLPALFLGAELDVNDNEAIARAVAQPHARDSDRLSREDTWQVLNFFFDRRRPWFDEVHGQRLTLGLIEIDVDDLLDGIQKEERRHQQRDGERDTQDR